MSRYNGSKNNNEVCHRLIVERGRQKAMQAALDMAECVFTSVSWTQRPARRGTVGISFSGPPRDVRLLIVALDRRVWPDYVSDEDAARAAGIRAKSVRRLVALGLIRYATRRPDGRIILSPAAVTSLERYLHRNEVAKMGIKYAPHRGRERSGDIARREFTWAADCDGRAAAAAQIMKAAEPLLGVEVSGPFQEAGSSKTWVVRGDPASLDILKAALLAKQWQGYLDADTAADALCMNARTLRRMCEQGRVPFARRALREQWMLPQASVEFLRRFPAIVGGKGSAHAERQRRQREQAAKLDPQCAPLQERWSASHPPGFYTQRAG